MIRLLPLLLALVACSAKDADDSTPPTTGTPSTGQLTTGPTTGTPATTLREPVWAEYFSDDVWDGAPDLHHPTHARMPDGRSAVFFDVRTANGDAKVLVRTFEDTLAPSGEPVEIAALTGTYGRPDAGPVPETTPGEGTGYAVTWHTEYDVWLGRVAADGTLIDSVQVNEIPGVDADRGQPDLAAMPDGSVIVVYHLSDLGASPVSRYATRAFDPDLVPLGPATDIAISDEVGSPPDIAPIPTGGYVVAWSTRTPTTGTVHLSWFDDAGVLVEDLRADVSPADETPSRPNVAVLPDGTLAVTWRVQDNDGTALSAWGRIYAPDRTPRTDPFLLQQGGGRPNVAAGPNLFLFTWEPGDTDRFKAQSFDAPTGLPLENPWEPLGGSLVQKHIQASIAPFDATTYSVLFTCDRGPQGSRQLSRSVYELVLRQP